MDDTNAPPSVPALPPPSRQQSSFLRRLLLLLLLLAAGLVGYRGWQSDWLRPLSEPVTRENSEYERLSATLIAMQHALEQQRHEFETLRTRLGDQESVNKSLREELLGVTERARLLEDAIATLAEKRQSGRDAVLLNEAELLLLLAQQRYQLFHDPAATINVYHQVDMLLAEMDDPVFTSVRQSISAEIDALNSLKSVNVNLTLTELEHLREQVVTLPVVSVSTNTVSTSTVAPTSRLWQLFGQFVRIRHGEDLTGLIQVRHTALAQELLTLDLREAEAALIARDEMHYQQVLQRVHGLCAARFDVTAPAVIEFLADLDRLASLSLAPTRPEIVGMALKELRNLRTARSLQRDAPIAPRADETSS